MEQFVIDTVEDKEDIIKQGFVVEEDMIEFGREYSDDVWRHQKMKAPAV